MNKEDEKVRIAVQNRLEKFGQQLEFQRKNMGYTQEELAKLCGTSQRVQSGYELGKVAPKLSYIYHLAAIGFDIQTLLLAGEHKGIYLLEAQEQTILDLYRQSDSDTKLRTLELLVSAVIQGNRSSLHSDGENLSNSAMIVKNQKNKIQKKVLKNR